MQPEKPSGFRLHLGPPVEKEMAPHSSALAWRIPGTGEPGGLPAMGSQQSRTRLKRLSSSSRASLVALVVKSPPANEADAGDLGSIPGSGRCPGGGNGDPIQYSDLENLIDRGAWRATVHGVTELDATEHRTAGTRQ